MIAEKPPEQSLVQSASLLSKVARELPEIASSLADAASRLAIVASSLAEVAKQVNAGNSAIPRPTAPAPINTARQQTRQSLLAGRRPRQALDILRLIAKTNGESRSMDQITEAMRGMGYKATRYYDVCNALADVGYLATEEQGPEKRWRVTQDGLNALNPKSGGVA